MGVVWITLNGEYVTVLTSCPNQNSGHLSLVLPFSLVGYYLLQSRFLGSWGRAKFGMENGTKLCHKCCFRLGLGGFQFLQLDFFPYSVKLLLRLLFGLQLPHVGFKFSNFSPNDGFNCFSDFHFQSHSNSFMLCCFVSLPEGSYT